MKRILIIFSLIACLLPTQGQFGRYHFHVARAAQGGTWPITDDFESYASTSYLAGNGEWLEELNDLQVFTYAGTPTTMTVLPATVGDEASAYYNVPINANHYSQVTFIDDGSGGTIGPSVRNQGGTGDYYGVYSDGTTGYLFRVNSGSYTTLDNSISSWSTDDEIRLEISGYVLQVFINDVLDTSVGTAGSYEDTSGDKLSGGYAGVCSYASTSAIRIQDWEGGEL